MNYERPEFARPRGGMLASMAGEVLKMATVCTHLETMEPVHPHTKGCEECLKTGQSWVHLRMCTHCGHVGCCDSSVGKHATKHYKGTGHPIIRSIEKGEEWLWCYVDEVMVAPS